MPDDRRGILVRASLAGLGATILVVACCAAAPLLLGAVGGLTLLTFTGVGVVVDSHRQRRTKTVKVRIVPSYNDKHRPTVTGLAGEPSVASPVEVALGGGAPAASTSWALMR